MINKLLGQLSPQQFLRDYWQKKPLLIRQAIPEFKGLLSKHDLITLSGNDDVQSRFVQFHQGKWQLSYGPFNKNFFKKLNQTWTLLVQGVNQHHAGAQALLQLFNFIPYQRLDDLMISVAGDGGGVGPHFDSYDVFLLQGEGKRRWQISNQQDQQLLPDAPLRVLKNFNPQQEWILEAGDMLYLPPNYAHHGVAIGDCTTYSIGFRAPSHQELVREFLLYLEDHIEVKGMYSDPQLKRAKHPAQISNEMIDHVQGLLKKIAFGKKEVGDFLGKYLTEPKPTVFFDAPDEPINKSSFLKLFKSRGVRLSLKSQMLFTKSRFYLNGEFFSVDSATQAFFKKLADEREIDFSNELSNEIKMLFYNWYGEGFIEIK